MTPHAPAAAPRKLLFGHPPGLCVLFFTEMWERFSYYGMRALLVFYMTKCLFQPDTAPTVLWYGPFAGLFERIYGRPLSVQELSSQTYGLYTGLVYLTPFFGGILADRWLGQRRAVILGGALMAVGHFLMASQALFFPALLFLILGNGCFKPNISTQVGNLYEPGDHKRDRAFSIFYVGINLGAFFSPLVCGTLGEKYGWHYGFGAAGVGMVAGLAIYLWGQKHLAPDNRMNEAAGAVKAEPLTIDDWKRIGALFVLCLFNIVFWAVYEQQGNTMALFADANTDRVILGWTMPASWFQSFNPAMIFLFTPALTAFWAWQERRKAEPASVTKMAIGCVLLGASFLVMLPAAATVLAGGKAGLGWLVATTFVLTIGELYLSPVGLSLVTKVAPPRYVSMLMGMWFLSSFFGNYLCGAIGAFWEKMPKASFFLMLAGLSAAAGLGMFSVLGPLKRAIAHGRRAAVDV